MDFFSSLFKPDIEKLKATKDVKGLIKASGYRKDGRIRTGAVDALGEIKDVRVIEALKALDADLKKKALEEYSRAKELSVERKEKEITEKLTEVEKKLKEQILNAEISIDNRAMHVLIDSGNKGTAEANRLYKDGKFDESKNNYENAKKAFTEALTLAKKRNFAGDKAKLEESLKSIEKSIEAALLSKGDAMLREAEKSYDEKKFADAEKRFSSSIEYLQSIKTEIKEELEEMMAQGMKGKIRSKLEHGKEKLRIADDHFKNSRYSEAKDSYKTAWNYLQEVMEEAAARKLTGFIKELNILIEKCSSNISVNVHIPVGVKVIHSK